MGMSGEHKLVTYVKDYFGYLLRIFKDNAPEANVDGRLPRCQEVCDLWGRSIVRTAGEEEETCEK